MNKNNILKRISIILSIIIIVIEIVLCIKMQSTWSEIGSNHHPYENASLIMVGLFRWGVLIWGILLLPMVWLEYLLTNIFIKIYNRFEGLKRLFLCLITFILIVTILVLLIKTILLVIATLLK